jgi:formylglycine-generating enzyme required for sulfatase activity
MMRFAVTLLAVASALAVATALANQVSAQEAPAPKKLTGDRTGKPPANLTANLTGSRAGEVRSDNSLKLPLVWIPPGDFTMGSPPGEKEREAAENQVPVSLTTGFWLGQHEVTQSEWRRVMSSKPWSGKSDIREGDDYPASYVSWDDATQFCAKLTDEERRAGRLPESWQYALPSEAQWEYACRAGTKSAFSFGDDETRLGEYAWWGGIFGEGNAQHEQYPHRVGHKRPNPFGLYDIHGNVFEWCRDWYDEELGGGRDPLGPSTGRHRVIRGGAWGGVASSCRSAYRFMSPPGTGSNALGLRVALVPKVASSVAGSQSADRKKRDRERRLAAMVPAPRRPRPPLSGAGKTPDLLVAPFDSDRARLARKDWARFHSIAETQTNSIGMQLTLIPPGEFQMGSTPAGVEKVLRSEASVSGQIADDEQPQHRVRITQPFYLGIYEVTKGQFHDFVDETGFKTDAERRRQGCGGYTGRPDQPFDNRPSFNWREWGVDESEDFPVVQVSRDDATAFCEWLSKREGREYRLPSEAEWEYACRAGTTQVFCTRDDPTDLTKDANLLDATARASFPKWTWTFPETDGWAITAPVGQFRPNNFGLYDMLGNAWEWCADPYDRAYYRSSPVVDPQGPPDPYSAVARGGSWSDGPSSCRPARRYGAGRISVLNSHGFRIVAEVSRGDFSAPRKEPSAPPEMLVSPFDEKTARATRKLWARRLKSGIEHKNSLGMKLLLIPPGRFAMGSPETADELLKDFADSNKEWFAGERPVHPVTLTRPFYLGKFEVTKGQFRQFIESTGYRTDAEKDGKGGFGYTGEGQSPFAQRPGFNWSDWGVELSDFTPVFNASHNDATAFCAWLSRKEGKTYRLPTEAEWEFACRAGTLTRSYNGNDPDKLTEIANVWDASAKAAIPSATGTMHASDGWPVASPGGRFLPNNFGLYDLLGNVSEWCADRKADDYYSKSPDHDPPGPAKGKHRILRGGSWRAGAADCRAASRTALEPSDRYFGLGFRVVLEVK